MNRRDWSLFKHPMRNASRVFNTVQECSTLFNSVQYSAVLALNIVQEVRHAILPSDDERPIKIHYRAS